jgi:hypothetical protein
MQVCLCLLCALSYTIFVIAIIFYHIHHLNDVILFITKIVLMIFFAITLCISLKILGYKHYVVEIISMYMDFDGLLLKVYIMLIFED